jgi:hypothetical protein
VAIYSYPAHLFVTVADCREDWGSYIVSCLCQYPDLQLEVREMLPLLVHRHIGVPPLLAWTVVLLLSPNACYHLVQNDDKYLGTDGVHIFPRE